MGYIVKLDDGRKIRFSAQPTQMDIEEAVSSLTPTETEVRAEAEQKLQATPEKQDWRTRLPFEAVRKAVNAPDLKRGERSALGEVFERPGAAIRSGIQEKIKGGSFIEGYKKGVAVPEEVPTFQDQALDKYYSNGEITPARMAGGMAVSAGGLVADIATNPADLLLAIIGKTPMGKGTTLAGKLGKTKGVHALGRFGTKQRHIPIPGKGIVQSFKAGKKATKELISLSDKIDDIRRITSSTKTTTRAKVNALKTKIRLEKELLTKRLNIDIAENSGKLSQQTQAGLKRMFKENSKVYGSKIDDIVNNLSKKQQDKINRLEVGRVIRSSIDESTEAFITEGQGFRALEAMEKKYGVPRTETGQFAKGEVVSLKEVLADLRNVKKVIKGSGRLAPDDIPVEILRKNIGKFLQEDVGIKELAELNKAYVPVMDMTKAANKTFAPYGGEFSKAGEKFYQKALTPKGGGKEGLLGSEKRLLEKIKTGEKGFAEGLGNIDKDAVQTVNNITRRIQQLEQRGLKISQAEKNIITKAQKKMSEAIREGKLKKRDLEIIKAGGEKAKKKLWAMGIGVTIAVGGEKILRLIASVL